MFEESEILIFIKYVHNDKVFFKFLSKSFEYNMHSSNPRF